MACSVRASELPTREDEKSVSANNLNAFDTTRDLAHSYNRVSDENRSCPVSLPTPHQISAPTLRQKPIRTQWGLASERALMPKKNSLQIFLSARHRLTTLHDAREGWGAGQKRNRTKGNGLESTNPRGQCDPAGGCSALEMPTLAANEAVSTCDQARNSRPSLSTSVRS